MMEKTLLLFQKLIIILAAICLFITVTGSFYVVKRDTPLFLFIPFFILLYLGIRKLFLYFENFNSRQVKITTISLFLLMTGIFTAVILCIHVVPINDSHSLIDQALSLSYSKDNTMDPQSIYANYFSKYSNNYLIAILFRGFFKFLHLFGITNVYIPLEFLNMICLMAGNLLTWLIVRKIRDSTTALKVLLLCTLNPVFYLMVLWVYSNTLSIPFMMAIIYLCICIYQTPSLRAKLVYSGLLGILCALGYLIRPTVMIPVIAILICLMGLVIKNKSLKMAVPYGLVMAIALISTSVIFLLSNSACQRTFSEVSDGNYPLTHWLMMGSHDSGRYNKSDDLFTQSFTTSDEKKEATLKKTVENYQTLGLTGTLKLFGRKICTVWSDGSFDMRKRLTQTMHYQPVLSWLSGEKEDLFVLYCRCFWLLLVACTLRCCLQQLQQRTINTFDFLIILSIFGGFMFYCLWEAKAAYAIPFIPLFLVLSGRKSQYDIHLLKIKKGLVGTAAFLLFTICFALCVVLCYQMTTRPVKQHNYSIRCHTTSWLNPVNLGINDSITQEFYPEADFNEISLVASCQYSSDGQNNCQYHICLMDDTGKILFDSVMDAKDIHQKGNVTLQMNQTLPASSSGYRLWLCKTDGTQGDISFKIRKGECLDTYKGNCYINNQKQQMDMCLNVYEVYKAPYCRPLPAILICMGLLIYAGWILFPITFSYGEESTW